MALAEPDDTDFGELIAEVVYELGGDERRARKVGQLLHEVTADLATDGTPPGAILLQALARMPQSLIAGISEFPRRRGLEFDIRENRSWRERAFTTPASERFVLSPVAVYLAVQQANTTLVVLEQFTRHMRVPLTGLLGMRGVSVLVSAVMVSELEETCLETLFSNPHQDGYPDLLPRTDACLGYCETMRAAGRWSDKAAWTDPGFGGVEVKATNGNTPPSSRLAKRKLGESRSDIVTSYDWKAHHQETTQLLGVIWDFVDGVPTISAAFYRNDLTTADWGGIVVPRVGGGRTTSVSVMRRPGLDKMAAGWMVRSRDIILARGLKRGHMLHN